jgi:uncharacterized protein YkuJ
VKIFEQLQDMQKHPVTRDPIKIAETEGDQVIEVYQGDFHQLFSIILPNSNPVSALDIFDKKDLTSLEQVKREWLDKVGGEVFIP